MDELPDGEPYSADDPELLTWVHASEAWCFLEAWKHYSEPAMQAAEQDRYFAEMRTLALRLGAAEVPASRGETLSYMQAMRSRLGVNERSREVVRLLLHPEIENPAFLPLQRMTMQAAVDLLPHWARRMHGLCSSKLTRPVVHDGTAGMAGLLRGAFR